MSKRVVIAGCGNIGSRLLQSIASVSSERVGGTVDVFALEPNRAARIVARERFEEACGTQAHALSFLDDAVSLPKVCDLAVIATDARNRIASIDKVLQCSKPKYVFLEKFLFTEAGEYEKARDMIASAGAVVNTSRNEWPGYQRLRDRINGRSMVRFSVSGSDWNLGSNGIHFLSLYEYLSGCELGSLRLSKVESVRNSKRSGYRELTGVLSGEGPDGEQVSISSLLGSGDPIVVVIEGHDWRIEVRESEGRADVTEAGQTPDTVPLEQRLASGLEDVFTRLLTSGETTLPTFDQSARLHLKTMRALNEAFHGEQTLDKECPVT